jgi:VacB/RNase II family 3'-5' exoribonuclease
MRNGQSNKQWVYRQFNSEKIRHIERYRRSITNRRAVCSFTSPSLSSSRSVVLLPDGQFLRKYLSLIEEIVHRHESLTEVQHLKLILLESAAENMDYRNSSPCSITTSGAASTSTSTSTSISVHDNHDNDENSKPCFTTKESPAINERNRIVKLCLEHKRDSSYKGVEVIPFPDLTLRDEDEIGNNNNTLNSNFLQQDRTDCFDTFGFMDMSIMDRSKCALVRAARLFYQLAKSELEESSESLLLKNQCSQKEVEIMILSEGDISMENSEEENNTQSGHYSINMKAMNCNKLISFLQNSFNLDGNHNGNKEMQMIATEHWLKVNNSYKLDQYGHFEHLPPDELQKGLRQKKMFKGKLQVTNENSREAYLSVKNPGGQTIKYYLNENNGHFNRSIHNDIVIIEPLPRDQWEQPIGKRRLIHIGEVEQGKSPDSTNQLNERNSLNVVPTARVVGMSTSSNNLRRQFVATLVPKLAGFQRNDTAIIVVPMDSKIPKIRIKTKIDHERIANKRLLVEIDGWSLDSMYPIGHYVKIIGNVGDLDTEINCLLIEHGVDLSPFSANALACLPQIPKEETWEVSLDEIKQRRDLRKSCRIFSVDPQGCQDIDDAMHAKVLDNGDIEVGVHIADVTHFVKLFSALDKEAAKRATTFYLVDRRFDMLPSLLSSNLCSLHGNVDRYAVSVIWTLSSDMETIKSTWYGRTVIHNIQAMTYEQAHNILHDKQPDEPCKNPHPSLTAGAPVDRTLVKHLKKDLTILTRLARKLLKRRESIGGAVDLSSADRGSELKFALDSEGRPIKVASKKELEIHHTIAELMIMSNAFVAETIYNRFPDSSILRIHRTADVESFGELEKLVVASGVNFDGSSNRSLARTLEDVKANQIAVQDSLFQSLATRAMSEAQYVCTGSLEEGIGLSHYGLGIGMYCHFTSPIRRYADIAVHHLLLASLSPKGTDSKPPNLTNVKHLNQLPESNAISILSGHGLKQSKLPEIDSENDSDEGFLDTEVSLENTTDEKIDDTVDSCLYKTTELTRICEHLNSQNRAAKTSSMQCQRLFLSLYFKNNVEVAQAIIIDLRQNGLIVYVPKFDMKGSVFLADQNGFVQMIPSILNLPKTSGLSPSSGFSIVDGCRMFPDGKCAMTNPDDETKSTVEITIPGATQTLRFKRLDVISVQLSCDLSNTTARIPSPRLHLLSVKNTQENAASKPSPINVKMNPQNSIDLNTAKRQSIDENRATAQSIFQVLSSIHLSPNLKEIPMRLESSRKNIEVEGRVQTLKGRMHYGGFKENAISDDLSNEMKTLSIEDHARLGNYDASRRIERENTARIQRKAAEKRNTKRAKRK